MTKYLKSFLMAFSFLVISSAGVSESENIWGIKIPESIEQMGAIAFVDAEAGFKFKNAYSSYFYQGMQRYEDPRLGYSLSYASVTGTSITVYVYSYGIDGIPDGKDAEIVMEELEDSIRSLVASGRYEKVETLPSMPLLSKQFLQSSHSITLGSGGMVKSYTLIRGQKGFFVKLRITGTSDAMEGRVEQFLKYLAIDLGIAKGASVQSFMTS